MPKVAVVTPEKATPVTVPGWPETAVYFAEGQNPLHLRLHRIAPEEHIHVGPMETDCVAYVWHGGVEAGGWKLDAGSSFIVEHGRSLQVSGGAEPADLLLFHASHVPAAPLPGGHVHLLPTERVPRMDNVSGGDFPVGGGMHANSDCPTCEVWLHENHFPGGRPQMTPEQEKQGVHSHSEDEIIFVIDGEIRLGNKLYGAGTAVAIAADTLYSFTTGPEGLSFINFRAGRPGDIQFANGMAMSETGYWKDRNLAPEYVAPR